MQWIARADQQQALDFILPRKAAAVHAGCGSGKTAIASAWADHWMFDACAVARMLIVGPRLVVERGWWEQFARWEQFGLLGADARLITFEDLQLTPAIRENGRKGALTFRDKRATKRHLQTLPHRVHLASWDALPFLAKAYGVNWPYQGVIWDESSFLRDGLSERGKAARHAVHRTGVVTHQLELTASPNDNHVEALYAQVDLLQPGLLGATLTEFRESFLEPKSKNWQTGQVYSWQLRDGMRSELAARLSQVAVVIPDNLGIEVLCVEHEVEPSERAVDAATALELTSVWTDPEGARAQTVVAGSAAVLHAKRRQAANGFLYVSDSVLQESNSERVIALDDQKLEMAETVFQAIGGQALVVYHWDEEFRRLKGRFKQSLDDIRTPGALDAFLAGDLERLAFHPASAAHGVDGLQTRTNHIVWMSVPEDAELFKQANGRLRRSGSIAATVMVHVLLSRNTVEERIYREVLPGKITAAELIQQEMKRGQ